MISLSTCKSPFLSPAHGGRQTNVTKANKVIEVLEMSMQSSEQNSTDTLDMLEGLLVRSERTFQTLGQVLAPILVNEMQQVSHTSRVSSGNTQTEMGLPSDF